VDKTSEKKGLSINQRTTVIIGIVLAVAFVAGAWYLTRPATKEQIIVSTTTSLYETGFLDTLKKSFEAKYPQYNVSFISQGTGLAIETAKKGNADLILVHDPKAETTFLTDGSGVNRKMVAYNFYIFVGPSSDPIGVTGLSPIDALKKIAEEGAKGNAIWVSRGDNSGTHSKEKALWKLAGLDVAILKQQLTPDGTPWYYEAGAGMTATLQLADQKDGYTIADVATFLKTSSSGVIKLVKVVDSGKDTLNVYSAIICNPAKNTRGHYEASMTLVKYMASTEGQQLFATYGTSQYGQTLFKPWITTLKAGTETELIQWVKDYAYIEGSDCPTQYRLNPGDLYS